MLHVNLGFDSAHKTALFSNLKPVLLIGFENAPFSHPKPPKTNLTRQTLSPGTPWTIARKLLSPATESLNLSQSSITFTFHFHASLLFNL